MESGVPGNKQHSFVSLVWLGYFSCGSRFSAFIFVDPCAAFYVGSFVRLILVLHWFDKAFINNHAFIIENPVTAVPQARGIVSFRSSDDAVSFVISVHLIISTNKQEYSEVMVERFICHH